MIEAVAFLVAAGLLAVGRSAVIAWLNRPQWPWGTLVVNTLGSLGAGIVVATAPEAWSTVIGIAALGALTTFSTFAVEVSSIWEQSPARSVGYVAATSSLAVGAAVVGLGF